MTPRAASAAKTISCQGGAARAPLANGRWGGSGVREGVGASEEKMEANEEMMAGAASDEEAAAVASHNLK